MPLIQDDFSVDRYKLELEAERNPGLMRKYGKLKAKTSALIKDLKRKLSRIESEQAYLIKADPEAYGLESSKTKSPTDKVVFSLARLSDEYIALEDKIAELEEKEEDYQNAVDVCRQRGMMVRILAELWLNNYYSEVTMPREKSETSMRKKLRIVNTGEDY